MLFRASLTSALLLAVACGGATSSEPGSSSGSAKPAPSTTPTTTPTAAPTTPAPVRPVVEPQPPIGAFTPTVSTNDVSILYPLPEAGTAADYVPASETTNHGELLPRAALDVALGGSSGRLEKTDGLHPSGYDALRLVSLRLDPCAARGNAGCHSEVRAVFQALYQKTQETPEDPQLGLAATDGGVHVMYDVPDDELVVMTKEILTLKKANGDATVDTLGPHPILASQGLGGSFAAGLRKIVRFHLGADRATRITVFDHNFNRESDGWTFGVFDRVGSAFVAADIPVTKEKRQMVSGSPNVGTLTNTFVDGGDTGTVDRVDALVTYERARPGQPATPAMQSAMAAALRVQNPTVHSAETMDCANCHLAEGARRIGEATFGLSTASAFQHARSLAHVDERTSVTNLHAFGYLGRQVSIMQRTANESVLVADRIAALLTAR